ncbi:hypothetical protein BN1708_010869 [Verticillium longisporum]|uniref:ferric-chelate reductase (NADPH) n=1 Tax=Verticillium longisporum TaxID=100787 RepID=A0A0G4KV59_VERLO|nr:hypothetical protein BN1708_010869 [Verticillium longisporum]
MGLAYNTYLNSSKIYGCKTCKAHLANHEDIISRNFRGQHGKAYLFNNVVNIDMGEPSERNMTTGRHIVRDITCRQCKETVGWKYDKAYETTEKYKEGKFILEAELLCNGTCGFAAIFIQAWSPIRHAFYEIFKLLHIALAILAVMGTWYHLHLKDLPQLRYLIAAIVIWAVDRLWRVFRVIYGNFGRGGSRALVEALPGNAVRVTVNMARPWTFRPGQHAYMYMPSLSYLQSHPFSVAWSEDAEDPSSEKLTMNRQDILEMRKTTMSFVIRGRTGFTNTLFQKASACPRGQMHTTCMIEGPYGELHSMKSYGTVMLFAGGVGITQAVPHVRDLVIGYANGTVATRRITLVWVIQSPEHLEWIRPWMTQILAMDKRRDVLRIMLFVSRPRSSKEIHSPSATVQMFPGRPNIDTLLAAEMEQQVGAMGVTVCGPGVLSDDVRRAVRARQYDGEIDFVEEAFSW